MISAAELRDRSTDVDLRAVAIGQIVVVAVFVATWIATRFDDTKGEDLQTAATFVFIVTSLPAFITGCVAGLAARKQRLRRGLLVGFAALVALGASLLYSFAIARCGAESDVLIRGGATCPGSWKDAVGAFVGAEFAIVSQLVVAWLFAGMVRKYPLRKPPA